ncbi:hypothetical protein G3I51_01665 [Streptomyces sp. SID9944]|nr:hypothetical protein [Streptomyces sp. SID9944]
MRRVPAARWSGAGDMAADLDVDIDADWEEETAAPAALRRRRGRRPAHPAG